MDVTFFPKELHIHRLWLIRELVKLQPKRVLDVGCGKGLNISYYMQVWPDAEYVGIDINEADIEEAKRIYQGKAEFHAADVADLPFKDKEFDLVMSDGVMMYVTDDKGYEELQRVGKNIILCEQHIFTPLEGEEQHQIKDFVLRFKGNVSFIEKISNWGDGNWDKYGWIMKV